MGLCIHETCVHHLHLHLTWTIVLDTDLDIFRITSCWLTCSECKAKGAIWRPLLQSEPNMELFHLLECFLQILLPPSATRLPARNKTVSLLYTSSTHLQCMPPDSNTTNPCWTCKNLMRKHCLTHIHSVHQLQHCILARFGRTYRFEANIKIKGPDNPTCQAFMYVRF